MLVVLAWVMVLSSTPISTAEAAVVLSPAYPSNYADALAVLALTGLANRSPSPRVWLNASSQAPGMSVPVNWPYPAADQHWLQYLQSSKNLSFVRAKDGELCTLLRALDSNVTALVKGIVSYEGGASALNALQFLATTAAGQLDAIPVASDRKYPCLSHLPTLLVIPSSASFNHVNLAAYTWGIQHLLPNASRRVVVGACRSWANYTCGWSDPLGTAAIDFAVQERAFVVNLSPTEPAQSAVFSEIVRHMDSFGVFSGWAEPETGIVALLSKVQGVIQCGAPNLSVFAALPMSVSRLPSCRSVGAGSALAPDPALHYVIFQSNEGDTPKNAYSLRGGNWLSSARGHVPIGWGSSPIIGDLFPGLWEYYRITASPTKACNDQYFAATGGVGYAYPWAVPNTMSFLKEAKRLFDRYMPGENNLVDLWEGGMNISGYALFHKVTNVTAFTQQPSSFGGGNASLTRLPDSQTPVVMQDRTLWYPEDKGFCPKGANVTATAACVERHVKAISARPGSPQFIFAYGVDHYVDVALLLQRKWGAANEKFAVIGTQDAAALAAAPWGIRSRTPL